MDGMTMYPPHLSVSLAVFGVHSVLGGGLRAIFAQCERNDYDIHNVPLHGVSVKMCILTRQYLYSYTISRAGSCY